MSTRISAVVGVMVAFFWMGWDLIKGSVPAVSSINIEEGYYLTLDLPTAISRWWDIAMVPVWIFTLVWLLTSRQFQDNKGKDSFNLATGLLLGLFINLGLGEKVGMGCGMIVGLAFGALFGILTALAKDVKIGNCLCFGLSIGLGISITVGLVVGLAYGLIATLCCILAVCAVALLRWLCTKNTWVSACHWLTAKDYCE